jgi:hypothetical protein
MSAANEYRQPIQALDVFVKLFERNPHLELEGRLGRYNAATNTFVSGVSKEYFTRIITHLAGSQCWSETTLQQQSIDYFFANRVRHSAYEANQGDVTVQKTVVATLTLVCKEREWDVRFRLCKEQPMTCMPTGKHTSLRMKKRNSFVTANGDASYDLTAVQSGDEGETKEQACLNAQVLEVEVEMLRGTTSTASSLFVKMAQLVGSFDVNGRRLHPTFEQVENTMTEHAARHHASSASSM